MSSSLTYELHFQALCDFRVKRVYFRHFRVKTQSKNISTAWNALRNKKRSLSSRLLTNRRRPDAGILLYADGCVSCRCVANLRCVMLLVAAWWCVSMRFEWCALYINAMMLVNAWWCVPMRYDVIHANTWWYKAMRFQMHDDACQCDMYKLTHHTYCVQCPDMLLGLRYGTFNGVKKVAINTARARKLVILCIINST